MRRWFAATALLIAAAALVLLAGNPSHGTPLWPGARYTVEQRDRAVLRGLNFIYHSIACKPENFREWGHDLLFCFCNIASTSSNLELRATAWRMGRERALEWRRIHPTVPRDADAPDLTDLVVGLDAAERLGVPQPRLRAELIQAVTRYSPFDFLWFDPAREPPPADIPEQCSRCYHQNGRGLVKCVRCGAPLTMRDPYDIMQDALINTFSGDRAGIKLGGHYKDVLHWLPTMRPYPARDADRMSHYYSGVYTVTHVIYTYNDYSQAMVSRDCFPEEFQHLQFNLREAIADEDPETMGEYLDSLRAFGLTFKDPLIRTGIQWVLSVQNPDGSWGEIKEKGAYGRYHPTWTAVDGLRDYRWTRVLPCPVF